MDSFPDPTALTVPELDELIELLARTQHETDYERQVATRKTEILRTELAARRGKSNGS